MMKGLFRYCSSLLQHLLFMEGMASTDPGMVMPDLDTGTDEDRGMDLEGVPGMDSAVAPGTEDHGGNVSENLELPVDQGVSLSMKNFSLL
jgi:hypothetical protein